MKKKPIALLLSLLMSLNIMAVSAAAEEPAADESAMAPVEVTMEKVGVEADGMLTAEAVSKMSINECIDIVNNIEEPEGRDVGVYGIPLSEAELAAVEVVLEYDRQNNYSAPVYKEATYNFSSKYYYNQLSSTEKQAYDNMYAACNDFLNSTTTLSTNNIATVSTGQTDRTALDTLYWIFYYSNPQFFFLSNGYAYYYDGRIVLQSYDSCLNGTTRKAIKSSIDSTTDSWMNEVNSISGSVAKEKWIADKICETVTYSYNGDHQSLKGALYDKNCVCNGYAMAMNYMCNAAGLECITVISANHAWNRIQLYGKWYEVDTTWMDQKTWVWYDWFNKSHATFLANDQNSSHDIENDTVDADFYAKVNIPDCLEDDPDDSTAGVADFVERLYTKLLGRASDPQGKAAHISRLKSGTSAADTAKSFVMGTELAGLNLTNREFVTRMYRTFMNREPDSAGLASWTSYLDKGCSYGYVFQRFSICNEFTAICESYGIVRGSYTSAEYRDKNPKVTAYVSRMYTEALNRSFDVQGLNTHTQRFITGQKDAKGIAQSFIFSAEFKSRNLNNTQYVECLYNTLFGRAADTAGRNQWVTRLNQGMSREEVFNKFASSNEFKTMVASFGI